MTTPSDRPEEADEHWLDRSDNRKRTHWRRHPSSREHRRERMLRDWFGRARATEEIVERQAPPRFIQDDVDHFLRQTAGDERILLEHLRSNWDATVGADIAKYTYPYALQNKRLLVEVSHPTWRYILEREHKTALVERLQNAAPDRVCDVQFIHRGRRPPESPRGNRSGHGGSNRPNSP